MFSQSGSRAKIPVQFLTLNCNGKLGISNCITRKRVIQKCCDLPPGDRVIFEEVPGVKDGYRFTPLKLEMLKERVIVKLFDTK